VRVGLSELVLPTDTDEGPRALEGKGAESLFDPLSQPQALSGSGLRVVFTWRGGVWGQYGSILGEPSTCESDHQ
jgi:hypothetical protein